MWGAVISSGEKFCYVLLVSYNWLILESVNAADSWARDGQLWPTPTMEKVHFSEDMHTENVQRIYSDCYETEFECVADVN